MGNVYRSKRKVGEGIIRSSLAFANNGPSSFRTSQTKPRSILINKWFPVFPSWPPRLCSRPSLILYCPSPVPQLSHFRPSGPIHPHGGGSVLDSRCELSLYPSAHRPPSCYARKRVGRAPLLSSFSCPPQLFKRAMEPVVRAHRCVQLEIIIIVVLPCPFAWTKT